MQSFPDLQYSFQKYLEEQKFLAEPKGLYEPINYILSLGGKRIRPILVLMACDLFCDNSAQSLPAAFAIEIFHNFSLLHDDIMDEAPLRRGQKTVHEKYDLNTGILSGDAMLIYAYKYLIDVNRPELTHELVQIFNKFAVEVCEGQQYDMDFENRNDVKIAEYLRMIELKTSVLLGGALKIGAKIGGATSSDADALYAFGKNIGIAFQLQDDILDTFGDPEKFGKKVGGDIAQNKKTYLLLKTKELASSAANDTLAELMSPNYTLEETQKINAVKAIYEEVNVRKEATQLMEQYQQKAFEFLNQVQVEPARKKALEQLAKDLFVRES